MNPPVLPNTYKSLLTDIHHPALRLSIVERVFFLLRVLHVSFDVLYT